MMLELHFALLILKTLINYFVWTLTFDIKKLIKREKLTNKKLEMIQMLVNSTFSSFHSSDAKKLHQCCQAIFMCVLKRCFMLEEVVNRKSMKTLEKEIVAVLDVARDAH